MNRRQQYALAHPLDERSLAAGRMATLTRVRLLSDGTHLTYVLAVDR